ncbi:MAG TPA: HD-GYP domain-containing protein [Solirubrobacterales bacterium]|nr:HD-GYP domain-containing protein [Solirubrobacterales bacterium]
MESSRPTKLVIAAHVAGLVLAVVVGVLTADTANWDLSLFGILLAFSVFSDLTAISTTSKLRLSGSFLPMVLAMVFLGGPPASVIAIIAITISWTHGRLRGEKKAFHYDLNNLLTFATFPLVSGLAFHYVTTSAGITDADPAFYALILGVFGLALAVNFTLIASYSCYLDHSSFLRKVRTALVPLLPSELAAALMAVGIAYLYVKVGLGAIALFGVVLITFQYLLGALLVSQERAEELERRSKQLASFQVGMLSAMLRTLDLRDQMTARHSAAVARYSRAIAQRAGFSRREEELVHIAALLHDIGKFILPDRILKANVPLTDEDWMLIKRHPQQGARIVSSLDGYGPVADIILAHHERIDGKGYPRGLAGEEIPELARIISVADTYDVMTARDSYRTPMSSYDAIIELRRVAGKQLDARLVEVFIELLEGKDVSFQHSDAADFEKELSLEARIAETANPGSDGQSRFQVAGVSG